MTSGLVEQICRKVSMKSVVGKTRFTAYWFSALAIMSSPLGFSSPIKDLTSSGIGRDSPTTVQSQPEPSVMTPLRSK